jgi:uncharacterized protein
MTKTERIILFIISLVLLLVVFLFTSGQVFPTSEQSIVIFSALLMLSFVTLFLEHYFTRPTDVLASTIAIILLLAPLKSTLANFGKWYWLFLGYNGLLLTTSLLALMLVDASKSKAAAQNRAANVLKRFSVYFGNGRFLFCSLFLLTLVFYVDNQSNRFLILAAYAAAIILIDPKGFVLSAWRAQKAGGQDIGEIIGVQSSNTFLAKLYTQRVSVKRFDIVAFRYSMDDKGRVFTGIIVDNYLLNEQQWVKILASDNIMQAIGDHSASAPDTQNVVVKLPLRDAPELLNRLVGVVMADSSITKLRFDYSARVPVAEGTLLEASVSGSRVLYQITQGLTDIEPLEQKNVAGLIVGEALQLGVWDATRLVFEKYGWVPEMNTPLLLATNPPPYTPTEGEVVVGLIPGTTYPLLLNLNHAVTHHTAILGVTGSGKSVFCRDLIRKIVANGSKVLCVDFTNEYRSRFPDLAPVNIVTDEHKDELFSAIDAISIELEKFGSQQNKQLLADKTRVLKELFYEDVKAFIQLDAPIALFELPDVSNTTGILEYTKWFFRGLFQVARQDANFGKQVCVVLEEAHTVVPEWNFIGAADKKAQSLVNSISQIALQGRKYNVGFIVVAQRTANVSKTILTQCNSIVAFQQFDKTSSEFLTNYMGGEIVGALSSLRFRQAIAAGKAFRSGVPLIFEVPLIDEPRDEAGQAQQPAPPAREASHR